MAVAWSGGKIISIQLPEPTEQELLAHLRRKIPNPLLQWRENPPAFVQALAQEIQAHLAGQPRRFSLENLALGELPPFFRKVYECAHRIPSGKTCTYGELARRAGSPKAVRAVGQAMARNPFPLVVPCHRVIGSGQALVGFSAHGGLTTKARLLELEAISHADRANHQS
jgi:methylated-DNA-[protein]-cysteine S-methyltransferase